MQRTVQLCLVPYENERGMKGTRELLKKIEPGMDISVMIGPEGGFSEEEIEMVREEMEVLSLGKRIPSHRYSRNYRDEHADAGNRNERRRVEWKHI